MLFHVQSKKALSKTVFYNYSIKQAYFNIYCYKFHASELELDNYLLAKYQIGLRAMCLKLLRKLQVTQPSSTELLYTFLDPEDDKMARLITYGDGYMQGSTILLDAFEVK
jgi:hypothetical protein